MAEIRGETKFWGKVGLGAHESAPPPNKNFVAAPLFVSNSSLAYWSKQRALILLLRRYKPAANILNLLLLSPLSSPLHVSTSENRFVALQNLLPPYICIPAVSSCCLD